MRIACVGAGPAGLTLALLAKQLDPRHEVTVYERKPDGVAAGWGVVFWDDLLDGLRARDPLLAESVRQRAYEWSGQVLHRCGEEPLEIPGGGYGIGRDALLDLLRRRAESLGVPVLHGSPVERAEELPDAGVVVACDGVGSGLRSGEATRFGTRIEAGRNVYAWLGSTRVFDVFTFGYRRTDAGWIWFHAYAFDERTSTLIVECTPETWRGLGLDRASARAGLALLELLFAEQLAGGRLLAGERGDDGRLPWRSFRRVTNERWHAGRLVLAGDAAHTTHFSIGSGTRLAIEDALALSAALHEGDDLERALERYERERRAALVQAQRDALLSARWFERPDRYANLDAQTFLALLIDRRSALQARLGPRAYRGLSRASDRFGTIATLRRWARRAARGARPPLRPSAG